MALTGAIGGPPYKAGPAVVDILGAVHLCAGILAAIRQRDRTGKGLMVELSLQESTIPSLTTHMGAYGIGLRQLRDGNRASGSAIVPYNAYPALDGWVMILAADQERWQRLCRVMEQPQLANDERFATLALRVKNRDECDRIIGEWTRTMTREQVMAVLSADDIFCGIVKELAEVLADPHLHQRGTLREIDHPELGPLTIFTSPLRFNGNSNAPRSYAPRLGQDNDAFYAAEFGLTAVEITALRERKVI
jgi:crotonobetainyl-CoA:carnitine CoA-transferase CaiB-like acyl-CoA transferase